MQGKDPEEAGHFSKVTEGAGMLVEEQRGLLTVSVEVLEKRRRFL